MVEEPGRRIVAEEMRSGGSALPWIDIAAFARRAVATALADRAAAKAWPGPVFFDRGLIDAAAGLEHVTGEPATEALRDAHRYRSRVFLAPPWPEIYETDAERRHGFDAAVEEYERLIRIYPALGYELVLLPKAGIKERADFVEAALNLFAPPT